MYSTPRNLIGLLITIPFLMIMVGWNLPASALQTLANAYGQRLVVPLGIDQNWYMFIYDYTLVGHTRIVISYPDGAKNYPPQYDIDRPGPLPSAQREFMMRTSARPAFLTQTLQYLCQQTSPEHGRPAYAEAQEADIKLPLLSQSLNKPVLFLPLYHYVPITTVQCQD